jgi:hypothetical protein
MNPSFVTNHSQSNGIKLSTDFLSALYPNNKAQWWLKINEVSFFLHDLSRILFRALFLT